MKRAAWLAVVTLLASTPRAVRAAEPAPPANAASGLDTLFTELAKSPGLFAKFRESRAIALLAAPLKSEGTVHFDRAHGLARHTRAPSKKSVLLTSSSLSFWDGKKTESVPLGSAPGLKAFADGFRMILAADRQGLEKAFELTLSGDPRAKWQLDLAPRDPSLKKVVRSITVTGDKIVLATLVVREANGDTTTTEFFEVDTSKRYAAAEAADVFRVPPKLP